MTGSVDIRSRTVGGLVAFCDWLGRNGYQGAGAVKAWKVAINKVFQTVEGDDYLGTDLSQVDLEDYISRFRRLAESQYKAESINTYAARVGRALDAQAYYIENDRPPTFKQGTPRPKKAPEQEAAPATVTAAPAPAGPAAVEPDNVSKLPVPPEFFELNYPLSPGQMVYMRLPVQMTKREIDRLTKVLETLEEQRQLPPGEAEAA